jgi:hypothetical protein
MTDKLSMLSDTEKADVETITMRLKTKEALQYMKDVDKKSVNALISDKRRKLNP